MSAGHAPHRDHGSSFPSLAFGLLTVSDTRRSDDDQSGRVLREHVCSAGHTVFAAAIVPDEPEAVRDRVVAWALDPACDAILATGGTGLSARDRTVEAVSASFDVTIEGFGELFRALSFQVIGSRAMSSRATAGVVKDTPVFLLPGSPDAVSLALTRLVLPEIRHIVSELRRHGRRS